MPRTTDRAVRQALMTKVIGEHIANPDTLVVEELGIDQGACRIDVAVVNGHLHGYEIKSDSDKLDRLNSQQLQYSRVVDRASLVVGERHLSGAMALIPDWWGVRVVSVGPRQALHIDLARPAQLNPSVVPEALAALLWRPEIISLLSGVGVPPSTLRKNRRQLCAVAAAEVPLRELRSYVRASLKSRTNWRGL